MSLLTVYGTEKVLTKFTTSVPGLNEVISLETQQLDETDAKAKLLAEHARLKALMSPTVATGPATLFVLDPQALMSADPESAATFQALTNAKFNAADNVAVAFSPADSAWTDLTNAMLTPALEAAGLTVLPNSTALNAWLPVLK